MTENPLVSICCDTYNHEKYIAKALEGFLLQKTGFPIEILVHDDASADGTADVIRQYQNKYPHLIKPIYQVENQQSKRIKAARFNFERALGDYIAICQGDDYWTDSMKLQKQVEFLERNIDYAMCFTNYDKVDGSGEVLQRGATSEKMKTDLTELQILDGFVPRYLTVMFRRSALDLDLFGKVYIDIGDVLLSAIVTRNGPARYLDFISGCYRVHSGGVWSGKNPVERCMMRLESAKATRKVLDRPMEDRTLARKMGRILFEVFRLSGKERSLRIFIVFFIGLLRNLFVSKYFFLSWREDIKKRKPVSVGK